MLSFKAFVPASLLNRLHFLKIRTSTTSVTVTRERS